MNYAYFASLHALKSIRSYTYIILKRIGPLGQESTMVEVNQPDPMPGPVSRATWLEAAPTPEKIRDFVYKSYKYDHYILLAQRAQDLIVSQLRTLKDSNGRPVHAKVSCRAKEKDSLEEKLKMRNDKRIKEGKGPYPSEQAMSDDIHDLAGVRILLYTPTQDQYDKITEMIQSIWGKHVKPRLHPEPNDVSDKEGNREDEIEKGYKPRHLGYKAVHYRASMTEEPPTSSTRVSYSWSEGDRVEVQAVSALGHAWAEAEHQVKYKSYAYGPPTEEEERLLDTLSGLVSSGELLLEQFSNLLNKRTYAKIEYRDDFGTFLRGLDVLKRPQSQREDGDEPSYASDFSSEGVDILFRFLVKRKQNYPLAVRNALKKLGFPDNSYATLKEVLRSFKPALQPPDGLCAPLCLIQSMILEHKADEKNAQKDHQFSTKCCIMMNGLTLLQTFAGGPKPAGNWLLANINDHLDEPTKHSLNFVLSDPRLCLIDDEDVDVRKKLGPELEPGWKWFQDEASKTDSVCGVFFKLAEMGATKNVDINTLVLGLRIKPVLQTMTGGLE